MINDYPSMMTSRLSRIRGASVTSLLVVLTWIQLFTGS